MGTIFRPTYKDRHGDHRESSVYWIQYFVGGKRERENTRSEGYEDAKNLLKMREGDVGSGKLTAASHGLLFNDLLDDVVTDYTINNRRSMADLEARLPRVRTFFGERKPLSISKADIARYVSMRQQEPGHSKGKLTANATVNRELAIIRRAFSLGIENGRCLFRRSWPLIPGMLATPRSEATLGCFNSHSHGQLRSIKTNVV